MMHPDHLPRPIGGQRALSAVVRVVQSPLLRLVWTLVLFVPVAVLLAKVLPSLARASNLSLPGALRNAVVTTLVLWASVRLLEGKSLAQAVGLSAARAPGGLARGFALGAGLLTAVMLLLALLGAYRVDGLGPGANPWDLGLAVLLFSAVAVFEELFFRGILFRLFEQAFGTWVALAIGAATFGLSHRGNPGATTLSIVAIALEAGVLLGAAYVVTRSLWLPIGMHLAWNLFEGPVYGAAVSGNDLPSVLQARFIGPDSLTGGAFGPEAGWPTVLLGIGLSAAFLVLAVRRGQVFTPRWMRRLVLRQGAHDAPLPEGPHRQPG